MLSVTLRGLVAHKRRLLSTAVAVVLGVSFMLGSLVLSSTLKSALADVNVATEQHTDVLVRGDATVDGDFGQEHGSVSSALAARLAAVTGVAAVVPRTTGYAQVLDRAGKPIDDIASGATPTGETWSADATLNAFRLVAGHAPAQDGEVAVDRRTATRAHLAVGSGVTVLTKAAPQRYTVAGIVTFATGDSKAGISSVLFAPATAQRVLGRPGQVDAFALRAAAGVTQQQLQQRVAAVLPAHAHAVTGAALADENKHRKNADASFFSAFTWVFAVVALLVGAFLINNTFSILVAQRTRELAVLRSLGASARQVRRSVVVEALAVAVVASAVGLGAGLGVARGLKALLSGFGIPIPETPLQVHARPVVTAFVVGVVVTVVSALLPARRASRVAPMAALRGAAAETPQRSVRRTVVGVAIAALGVTGVVGGIAGGAVGPVMLGALGTLLGVATLGPVFVRPVVRVLGAGLPRLRGVRGLLARENAVRNPRRSAATAASLMVGVSLVVTITAFVSSAKTSITGSFSKEFRGDYAVDSGAWMFGGLSADVAQRLSSTSGVEAVAAKRFTQASVDGAATQLSGWDAHQVQRVFDLDPVEGSVDDVAGGVAVGKTYADKHHIRLGQTLHVTFASGRQESLPVRLVFQHSDWVGQMWVDHATFARDLPDSLDVSVFVKGDGPAVRDALADVSSAYPTAKVLTRDGMAKQQASFADKALGLVYALLALAILIALLGIANTMALSVVERTREVGVLRAIGMQRPAVRGMVRWEAAMVSTFGAVMGVAVGLFLGWALVFAVGQSGVETAEFVVPWAQIAVIVGIAAVAGIVAAVAPARRAARLDVLHALATT